MGAQAGIVRCKALPQAEEALVANDLRQHILDRQNTGARTWPLRPWPSYPATLTVFPGHPNLQPKPPALFPHQAIFVFWLPVNHSHVLDPEGGKVVA